MCGLAGIFAYSKAAPSVDWKELLLIRERMVNRGPDGAGMWISDDQRIGLAHRRLTVVDLREAGAQPMQDVDTGNQIVFNGEIYNFYALRRELEDCGHRFRSRTDTEVLLKLYAQYGADMVHKLRGMYSFAIWDACRQGVFLARDPFGIKPLYLADDGHTLRFSSQVKAILAGGVVDTQIDSAGHVGFFLWGHVPEPHTLYKGVKAFPAGASLWIDRSGRREETLFFDLLKEFTCPVALDRPLGPAEAQEVLRAALLDSMRHHLVSDVPVGLFLSAGVDSATLLALATECLPAEAPLNTLTLAFREFQGTSDDEAPLAEIIARHYCSRHRTVWVNRQDFSSQLDALLDAMDQPSIDGVNSYFVCRAMRQAGLKVALSGLGGDEMFGGYSHFQTIPQIVRRLKCFAALPWLGRSARCLSSPFLRNSQISPKAAGLLEYGSSFAGSYLLSRALYAPWELERLFDREFVREGLHALQVLPSLNASMRGVSNDKFRISALEITFYMRNQLLRDADWAGMAHGVEVRVPFVDIQLFRTLQTLASAECIIGKRQMASTPLEVMPTEVLDRKKTGFSVPLLEWTQDTKCLGASARANLRQWAFKVFRQCSNHPATDQLCDQAPHSDTLNAPKHLQVGLLASELTGRGGIQNFMMRLVEVMHVAVASGVVTDANCTSLNDSTECLRSYAAIPGQINVWGAKRRKAALITHIFMNMPRQDVLFIGHISLAPLAYFLQIIGKVDRFYVILHGIEAWRRVGLIQRKALLAADGLISTTNLTVREFSRCNRSLPSKFHVIPLCVDDSVISPSPDFKLDGEFRMLCVARQDALERYKGFETVFKALTQFQNDLSGVHFNLVGTGSDQKRLMSVANEFCVGRQVTFWGELSDEDLVAAYRDCDVFVMPSLNEGFGIVFLEAMRCGKPCIGGNHGGTPEVIENGKSGYLVEYGDVEEIARLILLLRNNKALRVSLGERGRELTETNFSKAHFVRNYIQLIQQSVYRQVG